jgi:sialidase-1
MKLQVALTAVVVTTIGILSSASDAALFEESLVVKIPRGVFGPRGMMGSFIVLKDGTLMMSYTQDGIMAIKSSDQGKTWGQPVRLVAKPQPPAKGNIAHPSFVRMANGDILLSYIYNTYPTTPYYGQNYYRRSSDEGKTWSDPYLMTPQAGYCIVHNDRIHTLSTGRILAIAEYKAHMPSTEDHAGYVGMSFFSDDQGYSWQPSTNKVDMYPVEVQEGDSVELKDGRIMLLARSYSGHPVRAYSADQGATWSKGQLMQELKMPNAAMPSVRRIPKTHDLLFVWVSEASTVKDNPYCPRRCALSTAISPDEGKTFLHQRNMARDPDDDYGYQCIEFLGNDLAVIGYHCRDGLRVARIGIDWFYEK